MFKYSLDKVLKLKRIDESRSVEHLNECRQACKSCEQEISRLLDSYENGSRALGGENGQSGMEYLVTANHLALMAKRIQDLLRQRAELQEELERSIADAKEKVKQRQAQEKLKDRAMQLYKREKRRADRVRMDEMGQVLGELKKMEVCGE